MTDDVFQRVAELADGNEAREPWRPEILRPTEAAHRERLTELLRTKAIARVHDRIRDQLRELVAIGAPGRVFTTVELDAAVRARLGGVAPWEYGVWVYYPWSGRLVHLLDADELALVRTDRNRNKITAAEQARLSRLSIGVIGLSVGQSVCLALALERGFGQLRIADLDELALSNLNRVRAPLHRLGLGKAVIVAREIAELDPFLDVVPFREGITPENLDTFLLGGGKLDVLVDECDAIGIKLLARARARALGIPVVMDTSDRGLLDVERFDLEPMRPLLHGLVEHLDVDAAMRARTQEEKLPFVAAIVGVDTLSPRMKASMLEIDETITTWPQLASAVMLGGAVIADVVRRIALGRVRASGRWHLDVEQLVADTSPPSDIEIAGTCTVTDLDVTIAAARRLGTAAGLSEAHARRFAEMGALAPSAGNSQPWRFVFVGGRLLLVHERTESRSAFDPAHMIAHIGLGACIENVALAADAMDIALELSVLPDPARPELCASFGVHTGAARPRDVLFEEIGRRCTNRRHGDARPLAEDVAHQLVEAVAGIAGAQLHVTSQRDRLAELAEVCGAAERIRLLDPNGHGELFGRELRWRTAGDPKVTEGLDVDTLELDATERMGLRLVSDPRAAALLREWGTGHAFTSLARDAIRSSSAMALVSVAERGPAQHLAGGRAVQRMWLAATRAGLAVHPISAPIFLGVADALADADAVAATALLRRTCALLDCCDRAPLFLVRLAYAGPPSTRSARRSLADTYVDAERHR